MRSVFGMGMILAGLSLLWAGSAFGGAVTVNGTALADGRAASGAGWTFDGTNVTLTGAGPYRLSSAGTNTAVRVRAAADCAVTLAGLALDHSAGGSDAAASCGSSRVSVTLEGENFLAGGSDGGAGLEVASGSVVIGGAGLLAAVGNGGGAGIGTSKFGDAAGSIVITSGVVRAVNASGGMGAGIGGGAYAPCCSVDIRGGLVTAVGGTYEAFGLKASGAGIGGAAARGCGEVSISGGTVYAEGGPGAAGIGGGSASIYASDPGSGGTVCIQGGSVHAVPGNGCTNSIGGGEGSLTNGVIVNSAGTEVCRLLTAQLEGVTNTLVKVEGVELLLSRSEPAYGTKDIYTDGEGKVYFWLPPADPMRRFSVGGVPFMSETGSGAAHVVDQSVDMAVNGQSLAFGNPCQGRSWTFNGTNITLNGAGPFLISGQGLGAGWIKAAADCTVIVSNLLVDVSNLNYVPAFDCGAHTVTLVIEEGNGFFSGYDCAGIQAGPGATLTVQVNEEVIDELGNTTLDYGDITASGGNGGAGIGGGFGKDGGVLTMRSGIITANGSYSAGIGGGLGGAGGTIVITKHHADTEEDLSDIPSVFANGYYGAGIGSGMAGESGGNISILNGNITAHSFYGAGIGGGQHGTSGGTILIQGGTLEAVSMEGAGIGGGSGFAGNPGRAGNGGTITIIRGEITTTGGKDYTTDDTGVGGAGIGGGLNGDSGSITIGNGRRRFGGKAFEITATGGEMSAGIGGGNNGDCGNITFAGGIVTATAGNGGAAVGGGARGNGGNITITGGTLSADSSKGDGASIGGGQAGNGATVVITGGSLWMDKVADDDVPYFGAGRGGTSNGTLTDGKGSAVYQLLLEGFTQYTEVGLSGFGDYGVNDIYATEEGQVSLHLPVGSYNFMTLADDTAQCYEAEVGECTEGDNPNLATDSGDDGLIGVRVNGSDLSFGGEGWVYEAPYLRLTNAGPFVIAGVNTNGAVRIVAEADCTVTLSLFTNDVSMIRNGCAFDCNGHAVCIGDTGDLSNPSVLKSGTNRAGISVTGTAALIITDVTGLEVTGGKYGAGIGGDNYAAGENDLLSSCGTVTISQSKIKATGGDGGAGIGGGPDGSGGAFTFTGGNITCTGGTGGAGIGGGSDGNGGVINISGLRSNSDYVSATGTYGGAGIGGGAGADGGVINISGARVEAGTEGDGAGLGGGSSGAGGVISISGGYVIASSNGRGAGIGGGSNGSGGTIRISGGLVSTMGDNGGAGIGGGAYASGADVTITGGSICPGSTTGMDIGAGAGNSENGSRTNSLGQVVWRVTLSGLEQFETIKSFSGLNGYGMNDVMPYASGWLYLWLPEGTYFIAVDGHGFRATAGESSTNVVASSAEAIGVTVNGVDVGFGQGTSSWKCDTSSSPAVLSLTGLGPYVISGASTNLAIVASNTCVVTLSSLALTMTGESSSTLSAFDCGAHTVSMKLSGVNKLIATNGRAGIAVPHGGSLIITNAVGAVGSLEAVAGDNAAGIGSCYDYDTDSGATAGSVTIRGGTVMAMGEDGGAGIGGSGHGDGGAVTITGGEVLASGAKGGAGIGGGSGASAGIVTISGGTITARGSSNDSGDRIGAGIGGGAKGGDNRVYISGGSVKAVAGLDSVDGIGPGSDSESYGSLTDNALNKVFLVLFPYASPFTVAGGYSYTGPGHYNDPYLYFYLPAGTYSFVDSLGTGHSVTVNTDGTYTITDSVVSISITNIDPIQWAPTSIPVSRVTIEYCTDLVGGTWTTTKPEGVPRLFIRLRVK
jgi:hypothetical protein